MSSILTNNSAMVALQTLKSVNSNLQQTQSEISTGKAVASAKDNSAVWAISKVMESDVKGFKGIQESLSLGESTVAVARNASETVTDLLTDIKGKIVAAQEENVDREKIQTDINALRDQIGAVVGAAQFNGLNLVQGTDEVNILSSLDRTGSGNVSASNIRVDRQDLTSTSGVNGVGTGNDLSAQIVDAAGGTTTFAGSNLVNTGNSAVISFDSTNGFDTGDTVSITVGNQTVSWTAGADDQSGDVGRDALLGSLQALDLEGVTFTSAAGAAEGDIVVTSTRSFESLDLSVALGGANAGDGDAYFSAINGDAQVGTAVEEATIDQRAEEVFFTTAAAPSEGNSYQASIAGTAYFYTAGAGETMEDVARGLKTAIDAAGIEGVTTQVAINDSTGEVSLKVDNSSATTLAFATAAADGGEASGGLFGLDAIDVTSNEGADSALDNIETLIQNSIDAAASFGSAQGRIETQSTFIGSLVDSLKSGIGTLVDADMEEASARLQALQVQQQLATQSLSIANQAPQNILSLFR
ncbi:flagellin N-terminal helical domain-containing protein [Gymnodinialimonas hymeniacidonis]|uniref:flagellin N-terminal helical domain-containing protein n=1 Tax=Gymnodinialimonas hymeniacidonis TaxID=3126508 RepID=UPI0034C65553